MIAEDEIVEELKAYLILPFLSLEEVKRGIE